MKGREPVEVFRQIDRIKKKVTCDRSLVSIKRNSVSGARAKSRLHPLTTLVATPLNLVTGLPET